MPRKTPPAHSRRRTPPQQVLSQALGETPEPNLVAHPTTVYCATSDFPGLQFLTGNFLIIQPGKAPVVHRPITPAVAYAIRDHLRVCFEDEADSAPDVETSVPGRHLALVP